ncbi:MAG: glycoside hydrolase family 16 protein [Ignavibacteria bacterium]
MKYFKNKSWLLFIILPASLIILISCNQKPQLSDGESESGKGYTYELVFEDDFNNFDRSKWITLHDNGNRTIWSNNEWEWYKDENVITENGILKLVGKKESFYGKDVESEKQFEFTSGMICNSKSYTQLYGKWEMKVKFPFREGYWPAFFLVPVERPTLPELDVFEYFGVNEDKITCSHHWGKDYGLKPPDYNVRTKELTGNFSDQWMTWTFEHNPERMIWYLNGKKVYSSKQGMPTTPLYMIANLAIKGRPDYQNTDKIISDAAVLPPYEMEIDYVKIYKLVQ